MITTTWRTRRFSALSLVLTLAFAADSVLASTPESSRAGGFCAALFEDPATAAVSLARLGVADGIFTVDGVLRAFAGEAFVNPVPGKSPGSFALRSGFDGVLQAAIKEDDKERVRRALDVWAVSERRAQTDAQTARDSTKNIAVPQMISTQPIEDKNIRPSQFLWQQLSNGDLRAVGLTEKNIQVWYPSRPDRSLAKPHHIENFSKLYWSDRWNLISILPTRSDDILVASLEEKDEAPENLGMFESLAVKVGLKEAPLPKRINVFSFNTGSGIASIQPLSAVRKVLLTQVANGDIYVTAVTDSYIEVFRIEQSGYSVVRSIPLRTGHTTDIHPGLFPGGEPLVITTGRRWGSKNKSLVNAYNPIHSDSPIVSWKTDRPVSWVSPYITRSGELVATVKCESIGKLDSWPSSSLMYFRQSHPQPLKTDYKGFWTMSSIWHEDRHGRLLAVNAITGRAAESADVDIAEPFSATGRIESLQRYPRVLSASYYCFHNDSPNAILAPRHRVVTLADGREVLSLAAYGGVETYSLDNFTRVANVSSTAKEGYALASLPESLNYMVVANSRPPVHDSVIFQELGAAKPTFTFGNRRAFRFLPGVNTKDGRALVAFVLEENDEAPAQIVFFDLMSPMEGAGVVQ